MLRTMRARGRRLGGPLFGLLFCACSGGSVSATDLMVRTSFELEPFSERYRCYRLNVDRDVLVSSFETNDAPGIHHQILGVTDKPEAEGASECDLGIWSSNESWLFVAAAGANRFELPEGVAYHIEAGSQVVLQKHLFNPTTETISSDVVIEMEGIAEEDLVAEAALLTTGSLSFSLEPHTETTVTGQCTLDRDIKIFGLLPHMHLLGETFAAYAGDAPETQTVLYDGEFYGDEQPFERFSPVELPQGEPLKVECNYLNSTDGTVTFGEGANDEMCFGFAYYYPAIENMPPYCID